MSTETFTKAVMQADRLAGGVVRGFATWCNHGTIAAKRQPRPQTVEYDEVAPDA